MPEQIEIGLDPGKAKEGLDQLAEATKSLADQMDKSLRQDANQSVMSLAQAVEDGTNKIKSFFTEMGKKVKDDLKTAFNMAGIFEGAKFVSEMNAGIKSTFEMEKAFARLGVRLNQTAAEFKQMKTSMSNAVANTGVGIDKVMPGVELAASRGGVKGGDQLTGISEVLGQATKITGEDSGHLSDTVINILKNQGQKVTAQSFKQTVDALMAARAQGGFTTAAEAGASVQAMSVNSRKAGINTRQMAGLAAAASGAGPEGQNILAKLFERGSTAGGAEEINAAFGGVQLFKNGKLDTSQFKNLKKDSFGEYSQQIIGSVSQLTGGTGADLTRFIDSMQENFERFDAVTKGGNETATQFGQVSDNLASKLDIFKENVKASTMQIGESLSGAANSLISGDTKGAAVGVGDAISSAYNHKGTLAAGLGATGFAAMLAGGAANSLLSKVPGGGMLKGAVGAGVADAAGVQKVYVTNASEFGSGDSAGGLAGDAVAAATKKLPAASLMKSAAGLVLSGGGMLAAAAGGVMAGKFASDYATENKDSLLGQLGRGITQPLYDAFTDKSAGALKQNPNTVGGPGGLKDVADAVREGMDGATVRYNGPVTNPSTVNPRDRGR